MLQAWLSPAKRLLNEFWQSLLRPRSKSTASPAPSPPPVHECKALQRAVITDEVGRTLFDGYAAHQLGSRGDEETGWVLLGIREVDEVLILATLPAGAARDASVGHVRFNSWGQVVGSRIVRQYERRLRMLGVVHTHPGSLRHPSDGDLRGDSAWVGQLRGGEGVFGIGTADNVPENGATIAYQPKANVQCLGKLRLSWYSLRNGEAQYRPLPVVYTLGPDLARPLHPLWPVIEAHAERLDRLCRQQAGVKFEIAQGDKGPALIVTVPLAEPQSVIRVVLEAAAVRYYLLRKGEPLQADPQEDRIDRAVYLMLAELAMQGG